MRILRVSADSNPFDVSRSIYKALSSDGQTKLVTIGAGALNQAIKAIIIARGRFCSQGNDLVFRSAFGKTVINKQEMTTIELNLSFINRIT